MKLSGLMLVLFSSWTIAGITNFESEGNLKSSHPANCVAISQLNNRQNPADLFIGLEKCLMNKKYNMAAKLYVLAIAYGRFDTFRVKDKSAHQAIAVLRMNAFRKFNETEIKEFSKSLKKIVNSKITCSSIQKLGKPSYSPEYMLQHGMSAFTGEGGGIVEKFDALKAWQKVLKDVIKCPLE